MTLKKSSESSVAQSDLEKSEEFNGQFKGVFNKEEHSQIPLLDRSASFMDNICVSKEGVTKLLKELNPSKTFGPDELHPRVLKDKDYCPIEIIKGLTDKGQFQYLTKLMRPQEGTYLYATQFHSLR